MLFFMGKTLKVLEPLRLRKNELSEAEKLALSARAPFLLSQMVTQMKPLAEKSTEKRAKVRKLIALRNQCSKLSQQDIEFTCQSLIQ